ncbi:hypothetical protein GCM10027048_34570 [Hymenobacter coalescens]
MRFVYLLLLGLPLSASAQSLASAPLPDAPLLAAVAPAALPSLSLEPADGLPVAASRSVEATFTDIEKVWEPSPEAAALDQPMDSVAAPDSARTAAPDSLSPILLGLNAEQRHALGRTDAKRHYRPSKGVFWGALGTGVVTPFLMHFSPLSLAASAGVAVAIGASGPKPARLQAGAPHPELLRDQDYYQGYARQARQKKIGKAAAGWGIGTGVTFVSVFILAIIALSNGFS